MILKVWSISYNLSDKKLIYLLIKQYYVQTIYFFYIVFLNLSTWTQVPPFNIYWHGNLNDVTVFVIPAYRPAYASLLYFMCCPVFNVVYPRWCTGDGTTDHLDVEEPVAPPKNLDLTSGVFELGRVEPADIIIEVPTVSSRHALLRIGMFQITIWCAYNNI